MVHMWGLLDPGDSGEAGPDEEAVARERVENRAEEDDEVLCSTCMSVVTQLRYSVSINGSSEHTQINPHGFMYTIACYDSASGCAAVPPASSEFPWFAGYEWTIVACRQCGQHLGWRFDGAGEPKQFFGLIVNRLTAKQ
jgi:hypothetical protein